MVRTHEPIDKRLRARLRKQRETHCQLCNGQLGPILYDDVDHLHPLAFAADHIIPLSRGGAKHFTNLMAVHRLCNQRKGNRLPGEDKAPASTKTTATTTTEQQHCGTPPGQPCQHCRGVHNPHPGITFVTTRRWSAT